MSYAEMFLGVWAILSTVFGVWVHGRAKFLYWQHRHTALLLAEVVTKEVEPVLVGDMWVVENEDIRLKFKKVGD
jgi:hypothetical protein